MLPWRRRLALTAFFAVIATGLLSPLASNAIVPDLTDLPPHIAASWQARLALGEGQFPLRIAPSERGGRRYASLQLYGQFPYTTAALLQAAVLPATPQAPYVALKIVVWGSLVLAGVYLYRLARYLGARDAAALVAAAAYVAAPYLLVNLHARGAVAEAIAQGLLPGTIYELLRFVAAGGRLRFCKAALWAAALLLTHLITFAYSLGAAGLLILMLSRKRLVRRAVRGGLVAAGTLVLCLYFVAPIVSLRGALSITTGSRSTMVNYGWVTPIAGLLSPASVPPVPAGAMQLPAYIHPAVGLLSLAGALLAAALLLRLAPPPPTLALRRFAPGLLAVFGLGLLLAWSPVDVWSHLPDLFSLAQFTYRQITLTMWSGALLLALSLGAVLPRGHGALAAAAGCTLVLAASGSYLTSAPPWNEQHAFQLIRTQLLYKDTDRAPYSVQLDAPLLERPDAVVELAPVGAGPFARPIALLARVQRTPSRLQVVGQLPEPFASSGVEIALRADGHPLARLRVQGAEVVESAPITPPPSLPDQLETRLEWTATGPDGPVPAWQLALLHPVVAPDHLPFRRVFAPEQAAAGYSPVRVFERRGDGAAVRVTTEADALLLLPQEYYPSLLDVRLDDARVAYVPYATPKGQVLTAVRVPPGKHRVHARFSGHRPANAVSLAGWLALGVLAATALVPRWRARLSAR